jgi:apolipoprotein N-acyltransferase
LLFGLAFHGPLLTWIIAPAGYVGWSLLVAIQVVWYVILAVLVSVGQPTRWVILLTPAVWVGIDAWRSSIPLGGFAWGSIEYSQVANGWLVPVARLAGGRALAFVVVLLAAALYEAGRRVVDATRDQDGTVRLQYARGTLAEGNFGLAVLVAAMLAVVLVTVSPPAADGTADVLVVQGNDVEDWLGSGLALDETIAGKMLDETARAIGDGPAPDVTIWPESSIDRDPTRPDATRIAATVREAAALADGRLLGGVNLEGPRPATFLNSSVLFDRDGTMVDRYVKRRLVPFGEYVPFRDLLDWFPPLRQVPRDGVGGPGPDLIEIGRVRAAVAICFETMFTRVVRSNVLAEPEPANLLIASTNDASFGRSSEPEQHLAQTRLRAIETGRWAVHAAVSGRSTVVDPSGHVDERTDLFTIDHIRREIPLVTGRTPYMVTGDWVGVATRAAVALLAAFLLFRRIRSRR